MSGPDPTVWRERRVFLTGHTGFKGGWMSLWLAQMGAQVRGYALDPVTEPNLFTDARVAACVEDVRGDINNLRALQQSMAEFQPDIVFHMAAQPLVLTSYADPLETYRTNVMGTAHVLEAVRHVPSVRAVVCVTSDKCYENRETEHAYVESDPLGGYDPYSSSKACAEILAAAYRQSFFSHSRCGIATARAGNVIGGGDWSADRLVPDLLRNFQHGTSALVRNPGSVRPWQHVLESLCGYLRLAEELYRGNTSAATAWNFGPDTADTWPVNRVANHLAQLWGNGACWYTEQQPEVHEAGLLRLNATKAANGLGWHPVLHVSLALEWTVNWHREWLHGADVQTATLTQISAYETLLRSR